MGRWLELLRASREKPSKNELTKPTKAPFVSSVSTTLECTDRELPRIVTSWADCTADERLVIDTLLPLGLIPLIELGLRLRWAKAKLQTTLRPLKQNMLVLQWEQSVALTQYGRGLFAKSQELAR